MARWQDGRRRALPACTPPAPPQAGRSGDFCSHRGQLSVLSSTHVLDPFLFPDCLCAVSLCISRNSLAKSSGESWPGAHTLEGDGSGAAGAVPLSALNPAGLIAWEELKGLEMQRTALLTFQLCPGAAGGHKAR